MAMTVGSGSAGDNEEPMLDINTTPLIDVMLVLLIMLIITIPMQTHSVNIDLPQGNPPPPLVQPTVVTIDIDFDGSILWDGTAIGNENDLIAHFRNVVAQQDQPEVHVRPNKLASYDVVAHVMADAQRVGVDKLGIVGNEQYMGNN
ncbi:biopolymer transport protein ExbD [Endobacter medicaginis]|uniref:Biopolymer transport protein ExbD n=1 Tax=Endobacter medicaginis TaxID=1181271 RepID=A0A839UZK8_9PROT|nr:biopolymer transporter ExbD [Endobacter medicaginis]MBB3173560.1 biopolymer transport protein ExbD [Endobacter medicaginis]MCX5475351.1 biopolymer transporter ExbD [Endobacter medicaginis]NVN29980.1 biopolymer transporter ExbD [Endobacter medicaginis]